MSRRIIGFVPEGATVETHGRTDRVRSEEDPNNFFDELHANELNRILDLTDKQIDILTRTNLIRLAGSIYNFLNYLLDQIKHCQRLFYKHHIPDLKREHNIGSQPAGFTKELLQPDSDGDGKYYQFNLSYEANLRNFLEMNADDFAELEVDEMRDCVKEIIPILADQNKRLASYRRVLERHDLSRELMGETGAKRKAGFMLPTGRIN